jgi:hypothetical protein
MDPDSDDIIDSDNVKRLPTIFESVTTDTLPYTLDSGIPQFYLSKIRLPAPLTLVKLTGNTKVDCFICQKKYLLRNMRNHVGIHLLKARYKLRKQEIKVAYQFINFHFIYYPLKHCS